MSNFYEKIKADQEKGFDIHLDYERKSNVDCSLINDLNANTDICLLNLNQVDNPFGIKFSDLSQEIKQKSPFRKFKSYVVFSLLIVVKRLYCEI